MRVLHAITKGDVGGAQTHVVELALTQDTTGLEVSVMAGCDGPAMNRLRARGIQILIVESLGHSIAPRADAAAVREMRSLIRTVQPDVVHAHSSKGGLLARIAARMEGVASVYTAHGFPFQPGAPVVQRSMSVLGESIGGHLGDAVICLTAEEADLARRWRIARAESIFVVPNGLPDTAPLRQGPTGQTPKLIMVARFAPPKQQRELISILATLLDMPWSMTFVGDGPQLEACREFAAHLLGDRVEFLGHRDDVDVLTSSSDIALLWSGYEGMPIVLLEAMRAGLCCVASDLPGVRVLFGDPPAGLAATTPCELTGALRAVLADAGYADQLGRAARLRYESGFSIERMARGVQSVYDIAITRR